MKAGDLCRFRYVGLQAREEYEHIFLVLRVTEDHACGERTVSFLANGRVAEDWAWAWVFSNSEVISG